MKDQFGHASIRLTVDLYGHLVPGGNRAAVDRLDDVEITGGPDPCWPPPDATSPQLARANR